MAALTPLVIIVVVSYWTVATTMIFANKYLMASPGLSFSAQDAGWNRYRTDLRATDTQPAYATSDIQGTGANSSNTARRGLLRGFVLHKTSYEPPPHHESDYPTRPAGDEHGTTTSSHDEMQDLPKMPTFEEWLLNSRPYSRHGIRMAGGATQETDNLNSDRRNPAVSNSEAAQSQLARGEGAGLDNNLESHVSRNPPLKASKEISQSPLHNSLTSRSKYSQHIVQNENKWPSDNGHLNSKSLPTNASAGRSKDTLMMHNEEGSHSALVATGKLNNPVIPEGPDISVLIVWAQSVFGLTFLLSFRAIAQFFDLPLKELKHLRLPSLARRGDMNLIIAAVAQTAALIFNNLTLRLINVSFYQIARALTLVFVSLLSFLILRERIAPRVLAACMLIIAGFYVGVDQEVLTQNVHPSGVLYGSIASFFSAIYCVLFKRLQQSSAQQTASSGTAIGKSSSGDDDSFRDKLAEDDESSDIRKKRLQNYLYLYQQSGDSSLTTSGSKLGSIASRVTSSTLQFTYYNYLVCSVALAPAVFASCQAASFTCTAASRDLSFWCLLALSGLAGIAMSWVSSLQISLTSPLTHHVSINAKSVMITLTAVLWNGEQRSLVWWAGNALVVFGVASYTASKARLAVNRDHQFDISDSGRRDANKY